MVELSPDHAQQLRDLQTEVKSLNDLLARAKRAGLDTSGLEGQLKQIEALRAGLLREFGPAGTRRPAR